MTATYNHLGQPIGFPVHDWAPTDMPPETPMIGRYCRVEVLTPDRHADDLYEANAVDREQRNWTYLPYGPFQSPTSYLQWMRECCLGRDPMFHAVIDVATDKAVGVASYLRIAPEIGLIEVGHIHFSPLLQRRPAATEAMYLMMARAFELGYRRYEWKCDALNAPSRAAARRLGLSFEGVFRQATMYKGRNRDTAWYATIDSEWPALSRAFQSWLSEENFDSEGRQLTSLGTFTGPIVKHAG